MKQIARSVSWLIALLSFVIQLPLAGAGLACTTRVQDTMRMNADRGMTMGGATAPASASTASTPARGTTPRRAPCGQAAGAACQSMAVCTGSVANVMSEPTPLVPRALMHVIAATLLAPPSRAVPPDLPPPRA